MKQAKKAQHGLILGSVLLFLLIFSLLSFSALNSSLMQLKMTRNLTAGDRLFYAAENALQKAAQHLRFKQAVTCWVPQALADFYAQQPASWWHSNATCHIDSFDQVETRYVIEKIDQEDCVQVSHAEQLGATYYRITSWVTGSASSTPTILQSTLAIQGVDHHPTNCTELRQVIIGRQSWRLLQ